MAHNLSGYGYKASKAVFDVLAPLTPGTSESVSAYPGLYEIRHSNAPCVYVEAEFHDVPKIAKWIIENVVAIGEAIAKGICNYYGVAYKAAQAAEPAEKPKSLYRVQVGAFSVKRNAERLKDELKGRGYDAIIVEG
jgi:N-acetylmuramoyl-L-alanine amidase